MAFHDVRIPIEKFPVLGKLIADLYHFTKGYGLAGSFFVDNLITIGRNMGFMKDKRFVQSVINSVREPDDVNKLWRLHIYSWACHTALGISGDFVECGVYIGLYVSSAINYLGPDSFVNRKFYLYDTFCGLDSRYSTENEMILARYNSDKLEEEVRERFADYKWVKVVKGVVPDILHEEMPDSIAFLHLDLNAGLAETKALDLLYDRIPEGGIILIDDYGRFENSELFFAHKIWFAKHRQAILDLPTGQGLVVKSESVSLAVSGQKNDSDHPLRNLDETFQSLAAICPSLGENTEI